jgi:hypothetical protein
MQEYDQGTCRLEDAERQAMVEKLKLKWADTNAKYQALPFVLDTGSSVKRKEMYATLPSPYTICQRIDFTCVYMIFTW